MLIIYHFIATFLLAVVLFPVWRFNVLYLFLGGFLIDFDHYIMHMIKFKSLSLKKAYQYCLRKPKYSFLLFHTVEAWVLLIILSFFSEIMFIILIGLILHMILDLVHGLRKGIKRNYSILLPQYGQYRRSSVIFKGTSQLEQRICCFSTDCFSWTESTSIS